MIKREDPAPTASAATPTNDAEPDNVDDHHRRFTTSPAASLLTRWSIMEQRELEDNSSSTTTTSQHWRPVVLQSPQQPQQQQQQQQTITPITAPSTTPPPPLQYPHFPIFQPAGGYSLIDINRLATPHNNAPAEHHHHHHHHHHSAGPTTSPSRPSQFDASRAQLLADLQNDSPQPNPSFATATPAASSPNLSRTTTANNGADLYADFPEGRPIIEALLRYVPYALLLVVKSIADHMDGILYVGLLLVMFWHANWTVKRQIGRQRNRSVLTLVREAAYVAIVVAIVAGVLWNQNGGGDLWLELMSGQGWFAPAAVVIAMKEKAATVDEVDVAVEWPMKRLLYGILLTDMLMKLLTIEVKIGVTLVPPTVLKYRDRGRIYLFIEAASQLVRSLLPVMPWLSFLLNDYTGYDRLVGILLTATYLVAKGKELQRVYTLARDATAELFKIVHLGAHPSKAQLLAVGDQCPICHDTFSAPMRLACTHIFCESCVATWFDREPTCPLCRALVRDDPSWRDGATTHFIQFY